MKKYWPLFCLILIACLAAGALSLGTGKSWMPYFMGFFLCQFAMLKLFNPIQFVEGFRMYDLIASRSKPYAFLYPFIELVLGLCYLAFFLHVAVAILTILVFGVSTVGVLKALSKKLDVRCACMGTVLNVPLSTVTLTEDLVMIAMAVLMLSLGF